MDSTVVTFRAETAEDNLARFLAFAGPGVEVEDLGTLDRVRRYRVDRRLWSAYVKAASAR
jgi:hypothetical protein